MKAHSIRLVAIGIVTGTLVSLLAIIVIYSRTNLRMPTSIRMEHQQLLKELGTRAMESRDVPAAAPELKSN